MGGIRTGLNYMKIIRSAFILRGNCRCISCVLNFSCAIFMRRTPHKVCCILSVFVPNCIYNLLTGRISLIGAAGCQTRLTNGSQGYCVVGSTCDTSQETVVLKSVTLCLSFWRLQCCYICLCTHPNRPADIGY